MRCRERMSPFPAACGFEATSCFAHAGYRVGMGGLSDTLKGLPAQFLIDETATGQALHAFAHHNGVDLRNALQARGEVHDFTHRAFLGRGNDNHPGGNTDAYLQAINLGHFE